MKRFAAVTALAVIVGLAAGVPLASAGSDAPTMSVTPNPVGAGNVFTVTPDDPTSCPPVGTVSLTIAPADGGDPVVEDSQAITDDPWSFNATIDDAGLYDVDVSCVTSIAVNGFTLGDPPDVVIDYQTVELEVLGEFTVTADATSGRAGDPVGVSGEFCAPGLGDAVAFKFVPDGDEPTFEVTDDVQTVAVTLPEAGFEGEITVPDIDAGVYQLAAFCLSEGGTVLDGPVVLPFTVTAGPAVPVVDPPDFTG